MPRVWVDQDHKQVAKHGKKKASYYVNWIDPDGRVRCKSCGSGTTGHKAAVNLKRTIEAQLLTGTFRKDPPKTWAQFREEFKTKILDGLSAVNRRMTVEALDKFERLTKPKRMTSIRTQTIDAYIAKRRKERGKKKGSTVSPCTVNKELRHLKAALSIAAEWGQLPAMPRFRMLPEPEKLPRYITPDHFSAIYKACDGMNYPQVPNVSAGDWWKALIVMAYMTGWRINELLQVRRADVDLDAGTAITRHGDNKGHRDEVAPLHPVVVEHLRAAVTLDLRLFPWPHGRTNVWRYFRALQKAAGIYLDCQGDHEHTDACHYYGYHDFRRAFATEHADSLTPQQLQALMRHRTFSTTQRYINMASKLRPKVEGLKVPDVLKKKNAN